MALNNYLSVDLVVRNPADRSQVVMVILDNEFIDDDEEREELLRKKLGTYLEFVATGQLVQNNAKAEGLHPVIEVVYCYPPTQHMLDIDHVRQRKPPNVEVPVRAISLENFGARYNISPDKLQALKARSAPSASDGE